MLATTIRICRVEAVWEFGLCQYEAVSQSGLSPPRCEVYEQAVQPGTGVHTALSPYLLPVISCLRAWFIQLYAAKRTGN